ncbi:MAG: hypothetical protein M9927_03560 [Anaerolineae bacterium]|nr:hypothetical protein [Anaerolineae bacterium]
MRYILPNYSREKQPLKATSMSLPGAVSLPGARKPDDMGVIMQFDLKVTCGSAIRRWWTSSKPVAGEYVHLMGEEYYRIAHYDQMPPFFISLVSNADHWLFISSTGGLTPDAATRT